MTIKLDDLVARAIERAHEGHLFCYTASHLRGCLWRLSIVRDKESGHYPVDEQYFVGSRDTAFAEADRLNQRLRLPSQHVAAIIASSMRGTR